MDSTSQTWAGGAEHFAMDAPNDDFGSLIDFDLDNLGDFGYTHGDYSQGGPAALPGLPDSSIDLNLHPQFPHDHANGLAQSNTGFFDYGMAQYTQAGTSSLHQPQAQEQHMYPQHHGVPPTPNSVEMHGDPRRYMQQMDSQQALFDQRYHMRKDDASFTPLVSPAVTPHDARFQIPDFTMSGAYFSPLTSPALLAQPSQHARQQQQPSGSSTGHSPSDLDIDMLGEPAMVPQEPARKLRSTNKRAAPRNTNANSRVRQSPIVKPNRRKATVSSLIPPKEVTELMQEARSIRPPTGRSLENSETDSISPEPMLSDMRPPPKPSSLTASPAMIAMQNDQGTAPATPASLMRIHPSPNFSDSMEAPPPLEDLELPEPSMDRPGLSRLDTAIRNLDADTPRMSARKTPKVNPLSTPGGAPASGRPSPMLDAMSTPTSPAFSMTNGKKDSKAARNPKKRNSVSTSLVSPALRPKISPSIKPLLPEGANGSITDNTHALLLASKSNYQNILDGTTVPGVVYPTSLSTNLTSKRTSHKIAEQGRRNRINMALQEMQALLPSPLLAPTPDAKSPESAAQQSSNSKAAKVESAIDYIKQLKQEVSERDELLSRKDQEMDELRKQLAALRRSSSVSSVPEPVAEMKAESGSSTSPSTDNGT
ncbi:hypothetical protein NX059_005339 [Plenodomus lindquistii]|nr:hypothetical protein NX059_005339 [Plenodomus lindquistii]